MKEMIITALWDTCNCGCEGRDPWHKNSFKRKVKITGFINIIEEISDEFHSVAYATGTARFPWGEEEVIKKQTKRKDAPLDTTKGSWLLRRLYDNPEYFA